MSSHLVVEATGQIVLMAAALGIAATTKALASVLRAWIEQAARTRRLARALKDSRPGQRAEIIMAISQLEGKPAGGPGDAADKEEKFPDHGHHRPPVLIIQDKRVRGHHGD
jgi:hypothetical protein